MASEPTALQVIAGAAQCPLHNPERIKALLEHLRMNEKAFALLITLPDLMGKVLTDVPIAPKEGVDLLPVRSAVAAATLFFVKGGVILARGY